MIICSCRNISTTGKTKLELLKILFDRDTIKCARCLKGIPDMDVEELLDKGPVPVV
jgi:hypothetical protein